MPESVTRNSQQNNGGEDGKGHSCSQPRSADRPDRCRHRVAVERRQPELGNSCWLPRQAPSTGAGRMKSIETLQREHVRSLNSALENLDKAIAERAAEGVSATHLVAK